MPRGTRPQGVPPDHGYLRYHRPWNCRCLTCRAANTAHVNAANAAKRLREGRLSHRGATNDTYRGLRKLVPLTGFRTQTLNDYLATDDGTGTPEYRAWLERRRSTGGSLCG